MAKFTAQATTKVSADNCDIQHLLPKRSSQYDFPQAEQSCRHNVLQGSSQYTVVERHCTVRSGESCNLTTGHRYNTFPSTSGFENERLDRFVVYVMSLKWPLHAASDNKLLCYRLWFTKTVCVHRHSSAVLRPSLRGRTGTHKKALEESMPLALTWPEYIATDSTTLQNPIHLSTTSELRFSSTVKGDPYDAATYDAFHPVLLQEHH
ncbi:hypothetical protein NUW54_g7876 [Trametes sanguinea]|uniref:Uncharacterized protein n=1 Tax=Trametes sanguinea TaxID=158606 RepID=A0ACC1PIW8_9APHY|nr:hypothetical protein NUW54_g7876 [Trametes sanguinea]